MIMSLHGLDGIQRRTWREHVAPGLAWLLLLLVAGLIASTYVGHASSPYGVCYNAAGRSVPCAALPRR